MARRPISDDAAREAHAWYMAEPFRTLAQAATQYGLNRESLRLKAHALDLPMKARGPEKNAKARPKCVVYEGILEAYRAGTSVEIVRDYCEISNIYAWQGER